MSRPQLKRERVVQLALEIADGEGLEAVSFRRLAAEFGVTPMALYRHVTDRSDLLAAMTDLVIAEIELPSRTDGDWVQALRGVLDTAVAAYGRHPAARALSSVGYWSGGSVLLTERLIELLTAAGFSAGEGLVLVQRLSDAALAESWVVPDEAVPGFPGLQAALAVDDLDAARFGIEVILAGAKALIAERDRPGTPDARAGFRGKPGD